MKYLYATAALALAGGILAGCNDTAKGMEKDATDNAAATTKAAQDAGKNLQEGAEKAGEAAKDLGAAAKLTPQIKSALLANPLLNENGNSIDVDSRDEAVTLNGHVQSNQLKSDAERIAKKIMEENGAKQPLVNNLTVEKN